MISIRRTFAPVVVMAAMACAEPVSPPSLDTPDARVHAAPIPRALPTFGQWLAGRLSREVTGTFSAWPLLVGAGDIAECYDTPVPPSLEEARVRALTSPAAATAALLDRIPGTVVTLGDNAYDLGSPFDYAACYEPTWGRHRTAPSAGNHEYLTPGAARYFTYFAERSATPLGYYSYDVGEWHIVVLNSTPQVYACYPPEGEEVLSDPRWHAPHLPAEPSSPTLGRLCAGDAAQQAWLVADLQANANRRCTVAYFHHPRYSDHAELYALEAEPPAVRLEITFYEGGEPKRVETLSKGQRATALLPIILRPLPYPLLFDQREDDLDNSFIFRTLIKTIRELKHKRQLIVVTHNANIPVLAGADRVVVMQMETPSCAAAPRCGTVDEHKVEILDLLEGGAEAFSLREAQYHDLLPSVSDTIGTADVASVRSARV